MSKQALIEKAKAYTAQRYNEGYGWQVFTECYDTAEWDEFMSATDYSVELTTWGQVKKALHALADLKNEQYEEHQNY